MSCIRKRLEEARRLVPEVFPEQRSEAAPRIAEAALEGTLLFYGKQPVRVGRREIDWSAAHVAHQEWPAQLNRFGQLPALRQMYRDTGDERYARCARDYIADWIESHEPYGPEDNVGALGDSTLNMAIRLGGVRFSGWLGTLVDFAGSPSFDEAMAARIVESMQWQLAWLAANLPPWGNWRIAALDCLFANALRLPEALGKHLSPAAEALNIEFAAQILDDGAHVERSGGYHDWMSQVFLMLWRLGRRRTGLGLSLTDQRVAAMHAYTLHHTKPNGSLCGFNDSSGRLRTDEAGRSALGKRYADHRALLAEIGMPEQVPRLGLFASAGQAFYRTGWGADDLWWAFDAAGWGGAHSHLSRLSLELHNGRRTTLPDPGIFDYEMSNPFGPAGKSTPMHSTMNVNLGNQADLDARLVRAVELPQAVIVQGRYDGGYYPGKFAWRFVDGRGAGSYGVHDRTLVWLKDRAMIVLDCLACEAGASACLHWISDDVKYEFDGRRLRAATADTEGNVAMQVCPIAPNQATGSVHRGEKDPYLGWVAESHEVRPAPLFQFSFPTRPVEDRDPATAVIECATIIVPFSGRLSPQFKASACAAGPPARPPQVSGDVREVRIEWPDGAVDRVIHSRRLERPIIGLGRVRTDAPMVLILTPAGGQPQAVRIGGSHLEMEALSNSR